MKKYVPVIIFLQAVFAPSVLADVIKCKLASGKIVYQTLPCPPETVSRSRVEIIKEDPRRLENAQIEFKAWQAQQEANEAAKLKAAKEQQEESNRQEAVDALKRSAMAQEEQAMAVQRQAEALERLNQTNLYNRPYWISPFPQFNKHHGKHPDHDHFKRPDHHSEPNADKGKRPKSFGWRP